MGNSYGGITVPDGDPGALEASAGRLVATAGMLDSMSATLGGVLGGISWSGPASAAHATLTGAQRTMATTASASLLQKAAVINDYALVLEAAQKQARRAIEKAKDADRRIRQAKDDIRQAQADQALAQARILAAQAAQTRIFSSAVDLVLGDATAMAAVHAAEAEEAEARKALETAEERERTARRQLREAEVDRRDAQTEGDDAEEAAVLARNGLIAAAQGAGLLPTQPGGPADPAFAAAAGIRLEPPKAPKDDRNWFERRFDDVKSVGSWTWDQAKQVPGGVWEGTKGIYEGGKFLYELDPMNPQNQMHPGQMLDHYKQLAQTGQFAVEHPGEFGKALINYDDLAHGRYGEWAGNLAPDVVLAFATAGAGTVASRSARTAKAVDDLAEAERAYDRAVGIQQRMPTKEFRKKTYAAQADGDVSISGEQFDKQATMLERIGEDPSALKRQDSATMNDLMNQLAGHEMPPHVWDEGHGPGWYHGTHAELRLLADDPKVPAGITKNPCAESCNPALQRLSGSLHQDIVVHTDTGPTLYRADGQVVPNPSPQDFSSSRWPGALWGGAGAGAGMASGGGG